MKTIVLLALLGMCAAKYTTMYDNIDVEQILKTQRLLKRYVDCLKGVPNTCTREGLKLRELLPNALLNKCEECSEEQKKSAKRVSNYVIECYPKWWSELEKIYDPRGIYRANYQNELKAQGKMICYH
uniref:Chemosensory protein 02 n=1 Tax=Chrysomela lapponica TaxID=153811 RepID=A0A310S9S7_CHRLA